MYDYISTHGRYFTYRELMKMFNINHKHLAQVLCVAMIPAARNKYYCVPYNKRVKRNINRVYLNVGDKVEVLLNSNLYENNYQCTVLAEYDTYYLVEKDNGVKTTIHKIDENITLRLI